MTTGDDDIEPRAPAQQEELREETEDWEKAKGGTTGHAGGQGRIRRWLARYRR
jgi:hypothetical protein